MENSSTAIDYVLPHDTSNALVIPTKRRAQKNADPGLKRDSRGRAINAVDKHRAGKLSKKQLKKLQKIVERKQRKVNRSEIFEKLAKYQITAEEQHQLQSVAHMQQKSNKRKLADSETIEDDINEHCKINSIAGSGQSRKLDPSKQKFSTANIVTGFERNSSDSESSEDFLTNDDSVEETNSNLVEHADIDKSDQNENHSTVTNNADNKSADNNHTLKKSVKIDNRKRNDHQQILLPKKVAFVPVYRTESIQEQRMRLPICAEEQAIIETIKENDVVIICGETGSGKTTQVPQFLYEAAFTKKQIQADELLPDNNNYIIGITEPRRVAALAMSARVAEEMNLSSEIVSYQIRYEGNATEQTEIKFMTDGVLLKEIQKDFLLSRYTAIIIDEAHERSVYSDILIGLLSRIVSLRRKRADKLPLKVIIMSATLRVDDFTQPNLFKVPPPVIKIDSRQFPVTVYFNRVTSQNYLLEAYKKVCKIHRFLPVGGILVFVSGQQEVHILIQMLRKKFPMSLLNKSNQSTALKKLRRKGKKSLEENTAERKGLTVDFTDNDCGEDFEMFDEDIDFDDSAVTEFIADDDVDELDANSLEPLFCLPLYSLLPTNLQRRVFNSPPPNSRLCVVATNVAETSLTIPNIRYVVDSGKVKQRQYDQVTGISRFEITWISQASANQRAGRAGRIGPGHCYRLYSSAVFQDFPKFSIPEIRCRPVDDIVLQMKAMHIIQTVNFPFPSAPEAQALMIAEQRLHKLGALEIGKTNPDVKGAKEMLRISDLGRTIAQLPVSPCYGKVLALACQNKELLPYAICLVASLSVREPLVPLSTIPKGTAEQKVHLSRLAALRRQWGGGNGEALKFGDWSVLLHAAGAAQFENNSEQFCDANGLRAKAMREIAKLRRQLTNVINSLIDDNDIKEEVIFEQFLKPPKLKQTVMLRQIVLASLAENIARKVDTNEKGEKLKNCYQTSTFLDTYVAIHSNSVLYKQQPHWVIFQEIVDMGDGKKSMHCILEIEPEWIPKFAKSYCNFDSPLPNSIRYDPVTDQIVYKAASNFGPASWSMPPVEIEHPLDLNLYRHLAVAFLDGKLFSKLINYRDVLLASPETMLKSWAKLQKRTELLLGALVAADVRCKQDFISRWSDADRLKQWLLQEYLEWLPESCHTEVELLWPPLDL